jgi:hypothetical protein
MRKKAGEIRYNLIVDKGKRTRIKGKKLFPAPCTQPPAPGFYD